MTPTDLPLKLVDLSLKPLDLILLKSDPDFPILFPGFQGLQTLDQLPLLIVVPLYLLCKGLLSLLTTICTIVQCGQVLVNPTENVGDLLLRIMEGMLQSITLVNLLEELLIK